MWLDLVLNSEHHSQVGQPPMLVWAAFRYGSSQFGFGRSLPPRGPARHPRIGGCGNFCESHDLGTEQKSRSLAINFWSAQAVRIVVNHVFNEFASGQRLKLDVEARVRRHRST